MASLRAAVAANTGTHLPYVHMRTLACSIPVLEDWVEAAVAIGGCWLPMRLCSFCCAFEAPVGTRSTKMASTGTGLQGHPSPTAAAPCMHFCQTHTAAALRLG